MRLVAVGVLLQVAAFAQWLSYPTAGVPKLANGQPNLSAPTPRAADGKPDLSGLWANQCPSGGKTVFCAPEVAVPAVFGSLEEADQLFAAVKASGLRYMMFETSCFHADLHAMRENKPEPED